MIVYTKIISHEQINQFYVMACSFLFHHPNRTIVCQTDMKLNPINGVIYIDRFDDIGEYGDKFCFASPYITFFGNIDQFLDNPEFKASVYPNMRAEVKNDFYLYSKENRQLCDDAVQDPRLNASLPDYYDSGVIKEYRVYCTNASAINTREFKPWVVQRNSYKSLIFPWERYYDAMRFGIEHLDDKFVDDVITNCKRHPFMLFYLETGALSWKDLSH